jgi:hypothetical protein
LSSVPPPNKSDWDVFLKEFSEIARKYEVLLARLDSGQSRSQSKPEGMKQQVPRDSNEALRQMRSTIERICEETEEALSGTE